MNFNLNELQALAEEHRDHLSEEFFDKLRWAEEEMAARRSPQFQARGKQGTGGKLLDAILAEIYLLLCTTDAKYASVRSKGRSFAKACLPLMAGFVAGKCGVEVGVASSAVAFVAITVAQVGRASFCRLKQPEPAKKARPIGNPKPKRRS